ncbi:MAG: hydroxymethylglutaryl-CoA reductase, degradative [Deltaproteobacteria bacterium]|nr:hydroxymethylglutaryl-CoA reductase, degradative [Deltaproteobacteria bacterium]
MTHNTPPFEGFSKLTFEQRMSRLREFVSLSDDEAQALAGAGAHGLTVDQAENLIENVIGVYALPIGLATHFKIDGRDLAVPMAVEETSIIAAASAAAKWVRRNGGFRTRALGKHIIGQIQFPAIEDVPGFAAKINAMSEKLIAQANGLIPNLVARGGGVVGLRIRWLDRPDGEKMAVLHLLCDPCDAMGANLINQVCEGLKPQLEELTGERIGLCILSNLVDTKLVEATCEISEIAPSLGRAIEEATLFANLDPYRCATHNKGVMNGIDPVLIATGNDWRAVEAGMHANAGLGGKCRSMTEWKYSGGVLYGKLCAPIAVGTVGGVTRIHPAAKVALKILGVEHAEELARILAATGLAQNLAALRALCTEGIVRGHMRLHASNLAIMAGASEHEVRALQDRLRDEENITLARARELLGEIRAVSLPRDSQEPARPYGATGSPSLH